jgi:GAF domain-containing protein
MADPAREAGIAGVFGDLVEALRSGRELVDALDLLVQACTEYTDAVEAAVILRAEGDTYRAVASTNERTLDVEESQIGVESGPCIESIAHGELLAVPDVRHNWPEFVATALTAGFGGALALPLEVDGETVGGVNVFLAGPGELTESEVSLITSMMRVVSSGLSQRRENDERDAVADQLAFALESRVVIEQAKGYLSYEHRTSVGSAFSLLRRHARSHQLPLRDVAQGVVDRRLVL